MTWHVVNLIDVVPTPWKNGGGTTRELIAWPNSEHWVWRMSVAEVAQSGPFSRFEGVQRCFAVLDGAGVALTHEGQRHLLTVNTAPFCFDGGLPTACELLAGATQDFNLMVRIVDDGVEAALASRAPAAARIARLRESVIVPVHIRVLPNAIKIIAIYSISTWAKAIFNREITQIPPRSLVWRSVATHDVMQVAAEDALLIEIDVVEPATKLGNEALVTYVAQGLGRTQ